MIDSKKYFGKRNIFVTGRATTGLWLILQKENIRNKKILFPANICYAPVFGAVLAENEPMFIDINNWANISLDKIKEKFTVDVACVVLPHMYGKVVCDIEAISVFCKEKNILLIEDCASAFGATIRCNPVGCYGDYSIFSFDYSKIIDVGFGGIVASDKDLSSFKELEVRLPFFNRDKEVSLSLFSKLYRVIRNSEDNSFVRKIYQILPNLMQDYFLFRLSEEKKSIVLNSLYKIENERKRRWTIYSSLVEAIKNIPKLELCEYGEGDIPWRLNFLYKGNKKKFVEYLLARKIPVSDWYPFVGAMFGKDNKVEYRNAFEIGECIYNLPLNNPEVMIKILSDIDFREIEDG